MTKLQKSRIIYVDLVYVLDKFGIDITGEGIGPVIKGTIHTSLEKIEQSTKQAEFGGNMEKVNLRRCRVKINVFNENKQWVKEEREGYFHAWSANYEEYDNGAVNYPVAIVEFLDGSIALPYANDVVFLDKLS